MNFKKLALGISAAALIAAAGLPASSSAQNIPGYAIDAGTKSVVKNAYDECWQTSSWNEDQRIPECGGVIDSDGDGVPDDKDECPGTPQGVTVDEVGCPLDTDGDGVPDYLDKCPGTPLGTTVDSDGCPATVAMVHFAFDSADLSGQAMGILDTEAQRLQGQEGIILKGYTDNTGSRDYNQKLSERRADAVYNYLATKGISRSAMATQGFAFDDPIADNNSDMGRAENRRTEIHAQ